MNVNQTIVKTWKQSALARNSGPSRTDSPRHFYPNLEFGNLGPDRFTKTKSPSKVRKSMVQTNCPWISDSTLIISKLIDKCWFWLFSSDCSFCVFSLFGFLKQSKVIDFAWGLSYTDSSLIGQVNELFKRELSVGLVKLSVSESHILRKIWTGIFTDISSSRSAIYEIWWFLFELVREFLNIFDRGPS